MREALTPAHSRSINPPSLRYAESSADVGRRTRGSVDVIGSQRRRWLDSPQLAKGKMCPELSTGVALAKSVARGYIPLIFCVYRLECNDCFPS